LFKLQTKMKSIQVDRERVVAIIESINTPMVAAEERTTQLAKVFIVGISNKNATFSICIYLYLIESKECLIYLCDPPEIQMGAYRETELEALQFVESMGFMVDNLHFRNLSSQQQSTLLQDLPITYEDLSAYAKRKNEEITSGMGASGENEEILELSPIEDEPVAIQAGVPAVSKESLIKIVRLLSSF
jgi:hypothetical protein